MLVGQVGIIGRIAVVKQIDERHICRSFVVFKGSEFLAHAPASTAIRPQGRAVVEGMDAARRMPRCAPMPLTKYTPPASPTTRLNDQYAVRSYATAGM